MLGTRVSKMGVAVAALVLLALVVAACDPILHPNHTQVAPSSSGLDANLASADGTYVVATSNGTDGIVPHAGLWRIRRSDHAAVALPSSSASAISRDGSRIDTPDGLWVNGTLRAHPIATTSARAADLDAEAYTDAGGVLRLWKPVGNTTTVIDPGPAPPDTSGPPSVRAVADGGTIIHVRWHSTSCIDIDSFIDVPNHVVHVANPTCPTTTNRIMAASGTAYLDMTATTVRLVDVATGTAGNVFTVPDRYQYDRIGVAANGGVAWVAITHFENTGPPTCSGSPCPVLTDRQMVAVTKDGAASTTVRAAPISGLLGGFDVTRDGRFALVTYTSGGGFAATQVVDWVTAHVETLPAVESPPLVPIGVAISDDGRLVVTTTANGGWHEHTP